MCNVLCAVLSRRVVSSIAQYVQSNKTPALYFKFFIKSPTAAEYQQFLSTKTDCIRGRLIRFLPRVTQLC